MIGHVTDIIIYFLSAYQRLPKHTISLALVGGSCLIIGSKPVLNLAVFFQRKKLDKTSCMNYICVFSTYSERGIAFRSFDL